MGKLMAILCNNLWNTRYLFNTYQNHYRKHSSSVSSLLLTTGAAIWYNTQKYTNNLTWFAFKSDLLHHFKPVDYDIRNQEALDHFYQWSRSVQKYIRAFLKLLLCCKTHVSNEEALHHFQARFWDEVKIKFWFRSLWPWKLHAKLLTELVAYCSRC